MESSESPLDVLSRAATMIQDNTLPPSYEAARAARSAEHGGGKWRREKRPRTIPPPPEYSAHLLKTGQTGEPLDMSTRRMHISPPSYLESVTALRQPPPHLRPSVITCTQPPEGVCSGSGGVCDPMIDEHFRRSLGKTYQRVFADAPRGPASGAGSHTDTPSALSVDDHFAKALGETWLKLQKAEHKTAQTSSAPSSVATADKTDKKATLLRHRNGAVISI